MATSTSSTSAIATTAHRLRKLLPYASFEVAPSASVGWVALDQVPLGTQLDDWLDAFQSTHGHRSVAGSLLGLDLARAVIQPTVSAMVLDNRCPDPRIQNLAVSPQPSGALEQIAVRTHRLAVLANDVDKNAPEVITIQPDQVALASWWARTAVNTLTPLLAGIRSRAPFGLRGLWTNAADEVTGVALSTAGQSGPDSDQAWQQAMLLFDAFAEYAPVRLSAPQPFPIRHNRRIHQFHVRASCCLYYRSSAASAALDDRYCASCPLRDDVSRRQRLAKFVEAELS
ncbi:IucA/IucC family C-terminal-domain containing protein [Kribbella sp. CA-294648]|uniref:IucA/IucC family C-terminal-domain containing protein n=1 Tax=Kribbella sp. CA-294648 TaxID=3239948 RepID=UPI003D9005A8